MDYGVTKYDAQVLTDEREIANWFEETCRGNLHGRPKGFAKKIANWMITELLGKIEGNSNLQNDKNFKQKNNIWKLNIKPKQLAKIVILVEEGKISQASGKELLEMAMEIESFWPDSKDIEEIIKQKGLEKVSDSGRLEEVVRKVIAANPKPVADYKAGKKQSIQFLMGQVMRDTRGKADVKVVRGILERLLND